MRPMLVASTFLLIFQNVLMAQSAPTRDELVRLLAEASEITDKDARLQRFDEIAESLKRKTTSIPVRDVGKWRVSRTVSPIDDTQTVALTLEANSSITAWPNRETTPRLCLRFKEGELDCYVNLGVTPNIEYNDRTSATIRFDKFEAEEYRFSKSTDGEAIFFRSPKTIIERMAAAETMVLRFTPFNSPPVTTTFTLTGLTTALKEIEQISGEKFTPAGPTSLGADAAEKALKRLLEQTGTMRQLKCRVEGTRFIFGAEGPDSTSKEWVQRELVEVLQKLRVELEKQPSWKVSLTANGSTYKGKGNYSNSRAFTTAELTAMTQAAVKEARINDSRYVVRSGRDFDPEFYGDDPKFPTLKGMLRRSNDHVVIELTNFD